MPTTSTPAWKGASTGSQPLAGQVNQFLGTHAATFIYTGTSQLSQGTAGSGGTSTNSLYLAQSFTTSGAFTASRMTMNMSVTGSPTPFTMSIQSNSAGAPSGTPLAGGTIVVPPNYVPGSSTAISMPMVVSLSASTQYWIVINAVGNVSNLYTWFKSNQVSGASTSPTGSTWTAQGYGFLYNIFSGNGGSLVHTYEDAGARWTTISFNANGTPNLLDEYTVAQAANDYVYSSRTFGYSGSALTTLT